MTGLDYNELTKAQLLAVVFSASKLQLRSEILHKEAHALGAYDESRRLLTLWDAVEREADIHDAFCMGLHTGLVKTGSRGK